MNDDDSDASERLMQIAIADSLALMKRERETAADEFYAWNLQLEEEREYHHKSVFASCWTCSQCTFTNYCNKSFCEMCALPNASSSIDSTSNKLISRSATNVLPTEIDRDYYAQLEEVEEIWNAMEESLVAASKTWTCVTCHTINTNGTIECSQCREPKTEDDIKLWPCSRCTFDNSFSDSVCFMCGYTIPSHLRNLLDHRRPSECGLPGCCKNAVHYGFCSQAHFDSALKRNIIPPCESGVEAVLVGQSGDYTAHLLRSEHPKHKSVKKQFLEEWKKGVVVPRVERIFWIRVKPEILEAFERTKRRIGSNVQRLFHGTSQSSSCFFGTNQSKPPCVDKACRVCSIIRTSFDLVHAKRGEGGTAWAHQTTQLRYGVRLN
jgi:hypothetical protein